MTVTAIIMIILSITVLTLLLIFLNSQTGYFLSKWFKTQTTKSNVDAVVSVCDSLVTTQAVYAYCCETKDVVFGDGDQIQRLTCSEIAEQDWSGGRVREMDCTSAGCV